ncbi:capsid protein [Sinapis alba cryptic virus 1]|uniref:capsid protein n=1 Tax=Sinapis alba cryptic virus 1 TaxID=1768874 RepID=UPI0007325C44|nr:capsid protein [Sinapis alba cryptic virus 1]ALT00591.1 capsid protein [Sinapis alba cryptic virus 1]
MTTGDRVTPTDGITTVDAPTATLEAKLDSSSTAYLKSATDFLTQSSRIGTLRTSYKDRRRYVYLKSQAMFDSLVELYSLLFTTQWQVFRRFTDIFVPPANVTATRYLAMNYISMWIQDTYAMNRAALMKLSVVALNDRFPVEIPIVGYQYDAYLAHLSAALRPTLTKHMMEDTLWIPCFTRSPNFQVESPFGITGYVINDVIFTGAMNIMKERKLWRIIDLPTNVLGRPSWLFDWHDDDRVCAWFPMEGNFTMDDVTMAYILGVACTPKLAPCDVDDWQYFPNDVVPANLDPYAFLRLTNRRFHGGYEIRTLDAANMPGQTGTTTDSRKRPRPGESTSAPALPQTSEPQTQMQVDTPPAPKPRFRLVDWTYHYLVVLNKEDHTRFAALKSICWN